MAENIYSERIEGVTFCERMIGEENAVRKESLKLFYD
jgi:hypothetical protein